MFLEKNVDGKIRVVPKELELVGFIEDFARDFSNNYFPGRPLKLLLPSGKKTVKTDRRLLYHIVSNLVDNACKYSSQFERCPEIKLSYMEDTYCFCVKDYGIDIPKEDQKFVFDFFFRAKNVYTMQGTGLGLNIVSAMVSKLNGTISFRSDEGMGSTFNLTLPYDIS
jgi:signal transduction histidine kinase